MRRHSPWCECEIRYGPGKPSVSAKELSEMRMMYNQSKKKQFFLKMMDAFDDPTVSPEAKKDMFSCLYSPYSLIFEAYGEVSYRRGMAMAFSYKLEKWPEYLFNFDGEYLVILKNIGGKEYDEGERILVSALRLSIRTERHKESPTREILKVHACHDKRYYAQASLESSFL